jgi:hypothetical protein
MNRHSVWVGAVHPVTLFFPHSHWPLLPCKLLLVSLHRRLYPTLHLMLSIHPVLKGFLPKPSVSLSNQTTICRIIRCLGTGSFDAEDFPAFDRRFNSALHRSIHFGYWWGHHQDGYARAMAFAKLQVVINLDSMFSLDSTDHHRRNRPHRNETFFDALES